MYKPMYQADGTGRDTYVGVNNGGFFAHMQVPMKQNTRGQTMFMGDRQGGRTDNSPSIEAKHVSYNYNGSGRDTFIGDNNGGFYPQK